MTLASPRTVAPESNLERMMAACEHSTDEHARAILTLAETDIAYQVAFNNAYQGSGESAHAAKDRRAQGLAFDEWADRRRAQAEEEVWNRRARKDLALLSAMQTQTRFETDQT